MIQLDGARLRLLAAVASGFGLASARGGRAEGGDEPAEPIADSPAERPGRPPPGTMPRRDPVDGARTLVDGPPGCGRPLVIDGEVRVASLAHGEGSTLDVDAGAEPGSLPVALARAIGREWLRDALLEHASVAAFASFGLSLMAVGAPVALLTECQQASLDEIEHARACFAVADRYLGERHHAGPLDVSGLCIATTLEEVAVRTFLDGCVEETIAALTARAQLDVATDSEVREVLERIVEDETRHAELGWKFVAWAVATGGPRVTRALEAAARGLAREQPNAEAEPSASERHHFHHAGRLTPAERALVRERTLSLVIRPALEGVLDRALESGPSHGRPAGSTRARG